jgi:hypothetical protein
MAGGYYPMDTAHEGKRLAEVADNLKELLTRSGLSDTDDSQFDNAASDGGYVAYLWLAHELIERCLKRADARE